ncbi:MBL fold metallo-hydrolase [Candidatus Desulfosporosinus nitrosoreducens]|uniref:MBL fold metallo-hydrolase n=1 Tax=Candidatus Desulfosporosinus nitrosoreducens TaxID=3401928 RepID=UPI00280B7595|nr:MBL fold metallo-hydrolase [Desulfosporosinus sp. PR]
MTLHNILSHNSQNYDPEVKVFSSTIQMMGSRLNVYCYFVDGMLIDTGPQRMEKEISEFCLLHRPDKIIHTHYHEDHTGNTAYLTAKFQIPAYIHSESLHICQVKGEIPFYRRAFWGNRKEFPAEALPNFVENEHSRWEVIHTPGHTSDHVVFLDEDKGRLFSGDLFLHDKTRIVRRHENIPRLMESLALLLKKNFDTVYCAHAGVVNQGYRLIERKLHYLEDLQGQILTLTQKGLDAKAITRKLFPQRPMITYFSFGQFSAYHLVRSFIDD